jgi:hypothetical protein
VRPNWIEKPDRKRSSRPSRGKLAITRRKLDTARRIALEFVRASGATLHIDDIIRHIDDPHLDRRKLIRAL